MNFQNMGKSYMTGNNQNFYLKLKQSTTLLLYRLLHAIAFIIITPVIPLLVKHSQRVSSGLTDYMGLVKPAKKNNVILFHAVSMGEARVAIAIAKKLRKRKRNYEYIFTTTIPDTMAYIKRAKVADSVAYFPLDNYFSIKIALKRWRPSLVVISETDFWPEFAFRCKVLNIPLMLVNGRISKNICCLYSKLSGLSSLIFDSFSKFLVQTRADQDRLLKIGVAPHKITIKGNIKADLNETHKTGGYSKYKLWVNDSPTVVFGSIHPYEFKLLLPVFKKLSQKNYMTIIAPRNINKSSQWIKNLAQQKISASLATDKSFKGNTMVLNTMGHLSDIYSFATIAFIGGTLDPEIGGHNPLEIIEKKVPVISGPHYRNFQDIMNQLIQKNAILVTDKNNEILLEIQKTISDKSYAKQKSENAFNVLLKNKGALDKTVSQLLKYIN